MCLKEDDTIVSLLFRLHGKCSHSCCKFWLERACKDYGLQTPAATSGPEHNHLLVIASVATQEFEKLKDVEVNATKWPEHGHVTVTIGEKKFQVEPRLKKQARDQKKDAVENCLSSFLVRRGMFTDRMKKLSKLILQWLSEWANLTADQQENLCINVRYATTINRLASAAQVKCAGTLPFMQMQGCSNYCGVCAFNNLMGEEIMTVQSFNNIADD